MYAFTKLLAITAIIASLVVGQAARADYPQMREDGVTVIHLDEYNGYFAAEETVSTLKAGEYEFVITNKSGKLVGWQVQNLKTSETLDMFPLEPGETKTSRVTITTEGFRYRCPINPTPWYEVDNVK